MKTFSTGQLAKKCNVNNETVRYYERRGLIPAPSRGESGYRQFSEETVKRIRFIKHSQEVGFTLKEISELLSLRVDPKTTCAEIKRRTEGKITEVEEKIRALNHMRKALVKLRSSCSGRGPTTECPILEAMEGQATQSLVSKGKIDGPQ